MRRTSLLFVVLCIIITGCSFGSEPTPTMSTPMITIPNADSDPEPTTAVDVTSTLPEHVIAVREVGGVKEFYNIKTGEKFTPRGTNYVRLEEQSDPAGGRLLFQAAWNPGVYDPDRTDDAFAAMEANGYNVVRVFINHCCASGIGDPAGGLTPAYLDNLVDMLHRAKAHHLYVMFTINDVPKVGGYTEALNRDCCDVFEHYNVHFLSESGSEATQLFWRDFLTGLIEREAPLDAIWAYSLANEAFFQEDFPPLSLTEGEITMANGQTYDVSDPAQKEQMLTDNLLHYISTMRNTIHDYDPSALVTIGFFWPKQPHSAREGDPRLVRTAHVIAESDADFIDLHPYPGVGLTFEQMMENFGVNPAEDHLLVMGEMGAEERGYRSTADAARVLQEWQVASCTYGFDGWLTWTWDTFEQEGFYTELTGDEAIREALSPLNRPDPCSFGEDYQALLTDDAAVTVSAALPSQPATFAIDGDSSTNWRAGAPPYQWIQIDLGGPATISEIQLQVSQSPAGETSHQVIGLTPDGARQVIAELNEFTEDLQWLAITPDQPLENIRFIRIETTASPSWVAWRELQIFGKRAESSE